MLWGSALFPILVISDASTLGSGLRPTGPGIPILLFPLSWSVAIVLARFRSVSLGVALVEGTVLALLSATVIGLADAVRLALPDDRVATAYKLWGVGYLAVASAGVVLLSLVPLTRGLTGALRWPLWSVVAVAAAALLIRGHPIVAVAIGVGAVAAFVGSHSRHLGQALAIWKERPQLDILLVAGASFLTRAAFSLQALIGGDERFILSSDDGETYFKFARELLTGNNLQFIAGETPFAAGYSFFLAFLLAATGGHLPLVMLLQSALAVAAGVLLYLFLRQVAGRPAALIGGTLYVLNQGLIQVQGTLTAEALALPFIVLFLWALGRYERSRGSGWIVLAGIALAVATYSRNTVLIFLLPSVAWVLLRARPPLLKRGYVASLLTLAVLLPLALTNLALTGTARVTGQDAALAWGTSTAPWQALAPSNEPLLERGINPFHDPAKSLTVFLADPAPVVDFVARSGARRALSLLFPFQFGTFDALRILNAAVIPNRYAPLVEALLIATLLLGLAVVRDASIISVGRLLALLLITYVVLLSFVFANNHPPRYHTLIEPLLIAFEAVGLTMLIGRLAPQSAGAERAAKLHARSL